MKRINLLWISLMISSIIYAQKMNIEVNTKAKAYTVDSIQINAPVDQVYSFVANIKDWPRWFNGVTKVHINGNAEVGKDFTWKAQGYKMKSRLHTVRLNSDIGWTGKMWWIKAVHNWHSKSLPDGGTEVVVKEGFGGFGSSLLKNSIKKDMRNDFMNLKKESEFRHLSI